MAADLRGPAQELRAAGERAGRSRIEIVTTIHRELNVPFLRAHRLYLDKSAADLADDLGVTRQQLLKIENGSHRPEYDLLDRLCQRLQTNPIELGLFNDYTPETGHHRPDNTPPFGVIVKSRPEPTHREDDTDRRSVLAGLSAVPVGTALEKLRLGSEQVFSEASISGNSIDDWQNSTAAYEHRLRTEPPASVLDDLTGDYTEIAYHLARRQPIDAQRDLSHVAAQYAAFIARALGHLQRTREARRWWSLADTAAEASTDDHLRARVASVRATRALYEGRPLAEIVRLTRQARRLTHGEPCQPAVSAWSVEAQALAQHGHPKHACDLLIRQAEPAFAALHPQQTRPDNLSGYPEFWLHYSRSYVYTLAGMGRKAREAQRYALQQYPTGYYANRTQLRLQQTILAIKEGDVTEGVKQATGIIDALPPDQRVQMVMSTAWTVHAAVPEATQSSHVVTEYRDRLTTYSTSGQRKAIT